MDQVAPLVFRQVKAERPARIHDVVRIKVLFERAVDFHLIVADLGLQPRGGHLADAVVVAHRGAGCLDMIHDPVLVFQIFVDIAHLCLEDEIEVCTLWIEVRHMRHAHRVRAALAVGAHALVDVHEVIPVDGAFERVEHQAVVAQILAQVWIAEAAFLPAPRDDAGGIHRAIFMADIPNAAFYIFAKVALSLREAKHQAALVGFIAARFEQRVNRRIRHAVEVEGDLRLLRVRYAEHGWEAELALHDLAGGGDGVVPVVENIAEAEAVLRHVFKHAQGDMRQDAEGALAAHHDLIDGGAGRVARALVTFDDAHGGDIFLADDDILNLAVVAGVLARAARDRPAADGGVFKGLRKVAAGVAPLGMQLFRRVVEDLLELRAAHTGLHGDGLVVLAEADDLVEIFAHIERDTAAHGLHTARDGRTAAVDVHRDFVLRAVFDKPYDIRAVAGVDHGVRHILDNVLSKAHQVDHRFAIGDAQAGIVVYRNVCAAHNGAQVV